MQIEKLFGIIRKYLAGSASAREKDAVDRWYEAIDEEQASYSGLRDLSERKEISYQKIIEQFGLVKPVIPFYRKRIFRVAAAIILVMGIGFLFAYLKGFERGKDLAVETSEPARDVAPPQNNRAILTLSDGTRIVLDSTGNGTLATEGSVHVVKKENGLIAYNGASAEMVYNTLTVPRGSKPLKLALADGSLVWLNVASSIRYPVSFAGNERRVEISGEAYFEVAKDPSKPFVVKKANDNTEVTVLGTHFNVNAYDDEAQVRVTLLEGSVRVDKGSNSGVLKPGEQARVAENAMRVLDHVDLEEVMAWKDGRFYFDGADIHTIMRQIEKWYNVEVQYQSEISSTFVAKISRDVNASQILKIFESTDLVHFNIEGNKITVMK